MSRHAASSVPRPARSTPHPGSERPVRRSYASERAVRSARRPVLVPAGLALGGLAAALLGGPGAAIAPAAPAPVALATPAPVTPPPGPPPTTAPVPSAVLPTRTVAGSRSTDLPEPALDIWPRGLLALF